MLIKAAKFLGVEPWKLAKKPVIWMQWALQYEGALIWAELEKKKREAK